MEINKISATYGQQDLCRERHQSRTPLHGDSGISSQEFSDTVELSDLGVLVSKLKQLPNCRQEEINAALELIQQGRATEEASLHQAISRLLCHILCVNR